MLWSISAIWKFNPVLFSRNINVEQQEERVNIDLAILLEF